ncbi:protein-L-isoaspartate(D-aspartate) O-methyltransferase [Streptomyces sp. TX20-6-3]|uniref:protein-L-isoaspartate(D-aspartate) O-methyltransferase n=1 Tax=Streptomyces sp. TX20-6-3 TaxID=3028705 RepID=UPI0029AF6158|nr:protein-L-isoaspartate(D-aspartate) O-methyltransferase [Streptomyces sp. TX20-6-3]MDX2565101.1 protein-L-isoaspartate(D-aspartate) O-methyltransferase [Streptomyces sp. TX20-6-3]
MNWQKHAERLAAEVARPGSRWGAAVADTPRHLLVPRWYERDQEAGGRVVRDGAADPDAWLAAAYSDTTLVTRVGALHADNAEPGTIVTSGMSTSSSTEPGLVVGMYRHAELTDGCRTLVTTGTGYGTALACRRLGSDLVTSVDVDPYLVASATDRLASIGLRPETAVCDLTQGPLPGEYDRIVSTVSVPNVPPAWLQAMPPGGRLVTTITGTSLILYADKTPDGGAVGRTAYEPASFMGPRQGDDYEETVPASVWDEANCGDGKESMSRHFLVFVPETWSLRSMYQLQLPGVEHRHRWHPDRSHTVWMTHPDGSWARAHATAPREAPTVHQGGPRRLWDPLEGILDRINWMGELPVYGARVTITPEGETTLTRGPWKASL